MGYHTTQKGAREGPLRLLQPGGGAHRRGRRPCVRAVLHRRQLVGERPAQIHLLPLQGQLAPFNAGQVVKRRDKGLQGAFSNRAEGLTAEDAAHVFERFYTADKMRTGQSTGLGLAIVKALAERMGHTVAARWEDGDAPLPVQPDGEGVLPMAQGIGEQVGENPGHRPAVRPHRGQALTSILGYLQLLEGEGLPLEKRAEYLAVIEGRARTLQTFIAAFYDLSRIEGGELPLPLFQYGLTHGEAGAQQNQQNNQDDLYGSHPFHRSYHSKHNEKQHQQQSQQDCLDRGMRC